jgi:hypothetical protein
MAVSAFMGLVSLVWAVLVGVGAAQGLITFGFKLMMVKPVMMVTAFDPTSAVMLVILMLVKGYVIGYVFALVWNRVH